MSTLDMTPCPLYGDMGLTMRTCSHCIEALGAMTRAPYRQHLDTMFPGFLPDDDVVRRDCELCPTRGPCKGNRVTVRLPRPKRSWGQGPLPFPPSFDGPTVERPRIYKATHRTTRGKWACDRCDPKGREAVRVETSRPRKGPWTAEDLFS